jgi:prolyl-tRNA synthetase
MRACHRRFFSAHAPRVTPRSVSFSQWYLDALDAADLVDSATPVRGCAILRPRGFALWESIRADLDSRIRAAGASNVYFPLLVPASLLAREASHVAGFAAECAVVTHHRLVGTRGGGGGLLAADPRAVLSEPLVVRPTSEALVWDAFHRWVRSKRDLPLLVNQWASVVRWELRTRPFLRTSEFLWQEGHTAHAAAGEAAAFAARMQRMYAAHLREALAVPAVTGAKSGTERFAGASATLTCEALMQNGWALQMATAHDLGQRFSEAFDVGWEGAGGARERAWGTSWGASTRLIGGLIMAHGDDTGVVLPPAVAPVQVAVVALQGGEAAAAAVAAALRGEGGGAPPLRVALDVDTASPPGGRFYAWERRGVPLRVEVGKREAEAGTVSVRERVAGALGAVWAAEAAAACGVRLVSGGGGGGGSGGGGARPPPLCLGATDGAALARWLRAALARVQGALLERATAARDARILRGASYADLERAAAAGAGGGGAEEGTGGGGAPAFLLPWADDPAAEAAVKARTRYSLRCFPDEGQEEAAGKACTFSGKPATHMALFARAY